MYVHGGAKYKRFMNDMCILDVGSGTWSVVKDKKAPTRSYFSFTAYRSELYLFGGVFPNPDPIPDGCSNKLSIFNTDMNVWYEPSLGGDDIRPRSGLDW